MSKEEFYDSPLSPPNPLGLDSKKDTEKKVDKFVKDTNENPVLKKHDVGAYKNSDWGKNIRRGNFWKTFSMVALAVIILLGSLFLVLVSNGSFKPSYTDNSTTNINVDTPDIPITIDDKDINNYELTANVNVDLGDEIVEDIADKIMDAVNNKLNNTNSST